jgi:peptidoglycan/xylan/chitin deacetylase (PgdA/CDA1 family)
MSVSELRDMAGDRSIMLGCHGVHHERLTDLDIDTAAKVMRESRERLSALINRDIQDFAFPYGATDTNVSRQAECQGFTRRYHILPLGGTDRRDGEIGRVRVDPSDTIIEFVLKLCGAYEWTGSFVRIKRTLLRR